MLEADQCYAALSARDPRFDGRFFVGVSTTGIYCRPVCTAARPRRDRCSFFPHAAQAEAAGFRPCLRCRPELAPGSAPVDAVRRVAHQAAARIHAGALVDGDVATLASEFGLGERQLRRTIEREFGVSPGQLDRTRRMLLAKQLLTDTDLKVVEVAFASGFSSVRQFNRVFRERYRMSPRSLRRSGRSQPMGLVLKLGFRSPLAWEPLVDFLCSRGAPQLQRRDGLRYTRRVAVGARVGDVVAYPDHDRGVVCVEVPPQLLPVLTEVSLRLRRLFDLDANPDAIAAHLCADPVLAERVRALPGLRVPGSVDGFETAVRAIVGQQISVAAATTVFGRLVERFGPPQAAVLASKPMAALRAVGLTQRRAQTIRALACAVDAGEFTLDGPGRPEVLRDGLLSVPGIGPWTADCIAMRVSRDPDAFPRADLGLLRALGLQHARELADRARGFSPYRAYAAMYLWSRP